MQRTSEIAIILNTNGLNVWAKWTELGRFRAGKGRGEGNDI